MAEEAETLSISISDATEEQPMQLDKNSKNRVENRNFNDPQKDVGKQKMFILKVIELTAFLCITALLISSLKVDRLQNFRIWDSELWKWCMLILVIICGRLMGHIFTRTLHSLIWKFWLDERVLYFFHGVEMSIIVFIWLSLVGLAWGLLFHGGKRTKITTILNDAIIGCLIGVAIWAVKTLLVYLVGSFHARTLFERIEEAIRNRKAIMDLSKKEDEEPKLEKPKSEKVSTTEMMRELIQSIRNQRLTDLSCTCKTVVGKENRVISDEKAAIEAANEIFSNLAGSERYMDLKVVQKFVKDEKVIQHFEEVAEDIDKDTKIKQIKKSVFRRWVVDVYNDHESLSSTLKYSKTAIDELNKLASIIALVVILILWLIFMEFLTTEMLVFIMSQLVLLAFMFGNAAKTMFESIIFVFVSHPFDVGDRCLIDEVQMIVEQMNIFTTIFQKYDGETIYYPNSILAAKPIGNLYRSPPMSECVDFIIDLSTPAATIKNLKDRIQNYLDSNRRRWNPDGSMVILTEIEDMHKIKMALFVKHTINFHHAAKRVSRRSELLLEMKKIFEELKVEYHLLPQRIHLSYMQV